MRIGYLFRGYLADIKLDSDGNELSTPDGNATYSWCIEHECHKRKHVLIPLGENLDMHAGSLLGEEMFAAYSKNKRVKSYERMLNQGWIKLSDKKFPDLDVVLIEWRWPIPGRNTPDDVGKPYYQRDLARQEEVLKHYSDKGTPIILWDLDHKITLEDEKKWSNVAGIIETSMKPRNLSIVRTSVDPPFVVGDLLQHDINDKMPVYQIGYIGSRYERDETIDKWINPIAKINSYRVKFWGKWEPREEVEKRWPGIKFEGRVSVKDFREIYSKVAIVPLLAKNSYYECGFITPRPVEAVLFGSIPVGLSDHLGVENYAFDVATSPTDLLDIAVRVRTISPLRRNVFREEVAHNLLRVDVKNFVDVIEKLGSVAVAETIE